MTTPRFEFDPEKDLKNRLRHGIGFAEAQGLWRTTHVVWLVKRVAGEVRYATVGSLAGKIWLAVFTKRREVIRLISCHRADRRWERRYEAEIKKKTGQSHHRG